MDADLADDPVGTTSARMLAAGVPAGERRDALRLLGALEAFTTPVTIETVASEFSFDRSDCERWAAHLVAAGAVEPVCDRLVLNVREDSANGMRLHDFLDAVTELDDRRHHRNVVLLRPLVGALAVAAAVLAFVAFPRPASHEQPTLTPGVTGAPVTTVPTATPAPGLAPSTTAAPATVGRRPASPPAPITPPPTTTGSPPPAAPPSPCPPLTIPSIPTTATISSSAPVQAPVTTPCSGP